MKRIDILKRLSAHHIALEIVSLFYVHQSNASIKFMVHDRCSDELFTVEQFTASFIAKFYFNDNSNFYFLDSYFLCSSTLISGKRGFKSKRR